MTRTELLANLITDHLHHDRFMSVDAFREMFLHGIPGKLAFLAISRTGDRVLPIFETSYVPINDELVDYMAVRRVLGNDWTPIVNTHVWHRCPGTVPQTLLGVDGVVDERILTRVFGDLPRWQNITMGTVTSFNFGDYDINTLPLLALYTVDREGARRVRVLDDADEGRVHDLHLDVNGHIRYVDRGGKTLFARMEIGRDQLVWNPLPLKR